MNKKIFENERGLFYNTYGMTQNEAVDAWRQSAVQNVQAARDNMDKHPEWAFYLWHLTIEKTLKGLVARQGTIPPPIHNLLRLAELANVQLSDVQKSHLKEINTYNVEARYDDYKQTFYKKVTQELYFKEWFPKCEEIFLWLEKQY